MQCSAGYHRSIFKHGEILLLRPSNYVNPQEVIVPLTEQARQPAVQLGWWQTAESQKGAFAIDNVIIGSSAIQYESSYHDKYVSPFSVIL